MAKKRSKKTGATGEAAEAQEQDEQEQLPAFEPSLEEIQQIIDGIESGDVPLEESLQQYARGMKLIRHCRGILDRAESRIRELSVDEEGELHEQDENGQ